MSSRRAKTRSIPRVVAAVACAGALLGLSGAAFAAARTNTAKPTLRIGFSFAIPSLDPSKNGNGPGNILLDLAYAPLTRWNADGTVGPGLAMSWHYIGTGNKDFQFTLRHDARFSDGSRVTAAAVKASLDYFANNNPTLGNAMGPIRSINTIGQWTVQIHLKSPNPILPFTLSNGLNWGFIIGPKALGNPSSIGTNTDGAGPYVLDPSQTVSGDHYTFVPNRHYFDKSAIKYSRVIAKVITSPSSMLQAATTGQVDVALGDASTAGAAAKSGLTVHHAAAGVFGFWLLDKSGTLSKPLASVQVRQALNYAIDRKALVKAFAGNFGQPTSEQITLDGWDPKMQNYYSYSPSKAKALLAAAGYPNGFTFTALTGDAGLSTTIMQAVAQQLAAVDVTMDIKTVSEADKATFTLSGNYPAVLWTRGGDPMWLFYGLFLGPKALLNQHGWNDPVLDKLWLKGQRAKNPPDYWKQMSRRTVTQADFLPLYTYENIYYVSKHVGGVRVTAAEPVAPFATSWFPK
jgi:peptide/nickel transport system substrate-binding protein